MRLIDADYVLSKIGEYADHPNEELVNNLAISFDIVCEAPTIDIDRPQGEWIIHKINGIPHTVECSHCHQHYDYEELRHLGRSKGCIDIPHCPNCGAKMKGSKK